MCGSLLLSSHYDNDDSSNMKSNCIRHEFSVIYSANYNCNNYDNDNIMYFGVTSSQILHTKNLVIVMMIIFFFVYFYIGVSVIVLS